MQLIASTWIGISARAVPNLRHSVSNGGGITRPSINGWRRPGSELKCLEHEAAISSGRRLQPKNRSWPSAAGVDYRFHERLGRPRYREAGHGGAWHRIRGHPDSGSHDRKTMPGHFAKFIERRSSPGVIIVSQQHDIGAAIEDLILIWATTDSSEWVNRIGYLPI